MNVLMIGMSSACSPSSAAAMLCRREFFLCFFWGQAERIFGMVDGWGGTVSVLFGSSPRSKSPCLAKPFMPLAPGGNGGGGRVLGLGHQLDGLVEGGDGAEGGRRRRGPRGVGAEEYEGVGGVLLAQRPRLVQGGRAEEAGGGGGLEAEGGGVGGLEEGEELGGQFEEFVARCRRRRRPRVVEGDADRL